MNYLVIIMLLVSCSFHNKSMNSLQEGEIPPDTVSYEEISINGIELGVSKEELVNKLGLPDKKEDALNEFEGTVNELYYYNNSYFSVADNYVEGFDILDQKFKLNIDKKEIGIGDKINILKRYFPKSYKGFITNKEAFRIKIGKSESYILFEIKNEKIINYYTWTDW